MPNPLPCSLFVAKKACSSSRRLGSGRPPSAATPGYVLENKRLALHYDRLGFIVQSLLQSACIFLVAGRLAREF